MFNRVDNDYGIAVSVLTGNTRHLPVPLAAIALTVVTAVAIRAPLSRAYRLQFHTEEK